MPGYRDGYEALRAMCRGYKDKEIAHFLMDHGLWGHLSLERAESRVRACLNPGKTEFFHFSEIMVITQCTHQYDAVFYFCDMVGLTRPEPKSLAEQLRHIEGHMQHMASGLADAMAQFTHIKQQMEAESRVEYHGIGNVVNFSRLHLDLQDVREVGDGE